MNQTFTLPSKRYLLRWPTGQSRGKLTKKSAFTLIELSIVLIIIGLIVGGILVGRELIAQARLASQTTVLQQYDAAINAFRVRYGANNLPGDFDQAADFIPGTVSGDGDGTIENNSPIGTFPEDRTVCYSPSTNLLEQGQFFVQLAELGLIEGTYDGVWINGPGVGYPEFLAQEGTGLIVGGRIFRSSSSQYGNNLQTLVTQDPLRTAVLCSVSNPTESLPQNSVRRTGVLSPEAMRNLDTKADDGAPKSGKLLAFRPWTSLVGNCTSANPYDEYLLSNTENACNMMYVLER